MLAFGVIALQESPDFPLTLIAQNIFASFKSILAIMHRYLLLPYRQMCALDDSHSSTDI